MIQAMKDMSLPNVVKDHDDEDTEMTDVDPGQRTVYRIRAHTSGKLDQHNMIDENREEQRVLARFREVAGQAARLIVSDAGTQPTVDVEVEVHATVVVYGSGSESPPPHDASVELVQRPQEAGSFGTNGPSGPGDDRRVLGYEGDTLMPDVSPYS